MPELASTRKAYGKALIDAGKDSKVVVLDADLSCSTQTKMFADEYPERFFNVGVAEQNLMGTSAGLAVSGKTVFASTFAMFAAGRAWEIVRNTIAHDNLNVRIVATHGGVTVGEDGSSHQMCEDFALMRVLPNMTVVVPADANEVSEIIKYSLKHKGPMYIRLSRPDTPVLPKHNFALGKACEMRKGKDLTLIACGLMVSKALEAAEELSKDGIEASVLNVHTLKPLDPGIDKYPRPFLTIEEHSIIGGLGGAIAEAFGKVDRIGIEDTFGQSGKPEELLKSYKLTSAHIIKRAKQALEEK